MFMPGDKAKLVKPNWDTPITASARPYIGTEVTVKSMLMTMLVEGGVGYEIDTHDGVRFKCRPECLEKAQPPKEKTGSWESTPFWKQITAPKREPVEARSVGLA